MARKGQRGRGVGEGRCCRRKASGPCSRNVVLTTVNLRELTTKPVLGAEESFGMISLLESEMRWVNPLPKDKPIQKARNERREKSLRLRTGAAAQVPPMAVSAPQAGR